MKTWKRLFRELENWDEAMTQNWAKQFEDKLTGTGIGALSLKTAVRTLFMEIRGKFVNYTIFPLPSSVLARQQ